MFQPLHSAAKSKPRMDGLFDKQSKSAEPSSKGIYTTHDTTIEAIKSASDTVPLNIGITIDTISGNVYAAKAKFFGNNIYFGRRAEVRNFHKLKYYH